MPASSSTSSLAYSEMHYADGSGFTERSVNSLCMFSAHLWFIGFKILAHVIQVYNILFTSLNIDVQNKISESFALQISVTNI